MSRSLLSRRLRRAFETFGVALKFYSCVGGNHTTLDARSRTRRLTAPSRRLTGAELHSHLKSSSRPGARLRIGVTTQVKLATQTPCVQDGQRCGRARVTQKLTFDA